MNVGSGGRLTKNESFRSNFIVQHAKTMPINKSAVLRYRIIDECLTNTMRKYPSKDFIIEQIEEKTGKEISSSMFDKDIKGMKEMYGAPIAFDRLNKGYYYSQDGFSIKNFR